MSAHEICLTPDRVSVRAVINTGREADDLIRLLRVAELSLPNANPYVWHSTEIFDQPTQED